MHQDIKRKHMIFLQGNQLRLKKEILAKIEKKTLLILTDLLKDLSPKLLILNENRLVYFNWKRKNVLKSTKSNHLVKSGAAGIWTLNLQLHNFSLSPILCRQNWPPFLSPSLTQPPVNPRAWDGPYVTREMSLYAHAKFRDDRFSGLGVGSSVTHRQTHTQTHRHINWSHILYRCYSVIIGDKNDPRLKIRLVVMFIERKF